MERAYWSIVARNPQNCFSVKQCFVVDNPFMVAEAISLANPGWEVQVSALCAIRCWYLNGKDVTKSPGRDIQDMYSNITDAQAHAWRIGHEIWE